MWEGSYRPPFVIETKVIILEQENKEVRQRALALFAAKARRAVGLRGEVTIRITSSGEVSGGTTSRLVVAGPSLRTPLAANIMPPVQTDAMRLDA